MTTPPSDPQDPLAIYWTKPVSELVEVENSAISGGQAERHTMFSLLAMALLLDTFNGNKRGPTGEYPWREKQMIEPGRYNGDQHGDRYLGHNIACLAVDNLGEIMDFEFNHNELFNSSAEHAEARLIRRIFNLNHLFDHWSTSDPSQLVDVPYSTELSGVTLYTTLESCAQCSGIMALGNVKSVVYLQSDPGQYRIGNILFNLSNPFGISHPKSAPPAPGNSPPVKYGAPEPISGELFGFTPKEDLDSAYRDFAARVADRPFWISPDGKKDAAGSITAFICTDAAKGIFETAADRLEEMVLQYPDYPAGDPSSPVDAMSNKQVLDHARHFRVYAANCARRGTPHR